jgi:microcin C transport system substrate-binding protein
MMGQKMLRIVLFLVALLSTPAMAQEGVRLHGLAMHGDLKYAADYKHLSYVNPDAPKGGVFRQHVVGTFDTLNPYIVKGVPAAGLGMIYQTLLESNNDEAFSEYASLAASLEIAEDRSWVIFNIHEKAVWHDGKPITADDVVWTFNTLITEGTPFYKAYYSDVKSVEALGERRVKFTFGAEDNRELPLIVGQMPVLPKHYWTADGNVFSDTTLKPPLGSGPYKIGTVKPGESIEYLRVTDWWAADLPINRGRYNFDRITYDYYRDANVAMEAFLGGRYDFRQENTARLWATAYDSPAVRDGRIKRETIPHELPQGMQGFIYNIRKPVFRDIKVREALAYAFDFEWSNRQYAYDSYTRSRSYFSNSDMAATGLPDAAELAVLEPFRNQLPPEVFEKSYAPPKTDGSGNLRDNLRTAARILDEAGYILGKDGVRVHKDTGVRLEFEFIDNNPAFERWVMPFVQNLNKIGVKATYRTIDQSQYQNRLNTFDYDMTVMVIPQSSSPGNEQREFWGSDRADMAGSRNYIGIKDPVVDALVSKIIASKTREELIINCRALDRVLQWGHYLIPNWHMPAWRIAYWDKFGKPEKTPDYGLSVSDVWWAKP